jgi:hypothetical protein
MNVKTIKLANGEELVADVKSVEHGVISAENVLVMQMMPHPQTGQMMRAFGDWPALVKPGETIFIPITSVLCFPVKAHEEIERQYTMNVTGIELPPATPQIILG